MLCTTFHITQRTQHEHTEGLKYGDNMGHYINVWWKKVKINFFLFPSHLVVLLVIWIWPSTKYIFGRTGQLLENLITWIMTNNNGDYVILSANTSLHMPINHQYHNQFYTIIKIFCHNSTACIPAGIFSMTYSRVHICSLLFLTIINCTNSVETTINLWWR